MIVNKFIIKLFLIFGIFNLSFSPFVYANSSFEDLIDEVAIELEISYSLSNEVVRTTFRKITERMMEDKGTSIPDFGRFYVREKQKSGGRDKDGYSMGVRMIRYPRCSISKELKEILEETK